LKVKTDVLYILTLRAPSTRGDKVVWLFEELQIPYKLKLYKNHFQNKEMKKLPSQGKVPYVEIKYKDGTTFGLSETAYIFSYFLRKFNSEKRLIPGNEVDQELAEFYVAYLEGTVSPLFIALFLSKNINTPDSLADKFYNKPNFDRNVKNLENIMHQQHKKGSKYLVGQQLSHADVMILTMLILSFSFELLDKAEYPDLFKYYQDLLQEPGYIKTKAINKATMAKL
jgi:glutathione S-transferase